MLSNLSSSDGNTIYISNSTDTDAVYTITVYDVLARYVTIKRYGTLTICEVVLYESGDYLYFTTQI